MMKPKTPLRIILCIALATASAQAVVIITPTGAISSTTIGGSRTITQAIDGSGLSSNPGSILDQTHAVNSGTDGYYLSASGDTTPWFVFTLAEPSTVDAVHIWTYARSGENTRAIKDFDISFSTDGGINYGPTISLTGWLARPNLDPIPVQSQSFATQLNVTHIRIDVTANHGNGSFTGLSEIRFSAIPEPTTALAGLLLGLGLLRRRRAAPVSSPNASRMFTEFSNG